MKMYAVMERIPNRKGLAKFVLVEIFFKKIHAERCMKNMYDTMRDLRDFYIKEIEPGDTYTDAAEKLQKIVRAFNDILNPIEEQNDFTLTKSYLAEENYLQRHMLPNTISEENKIEII